MDDLNDLLVKIALFFPFTWSETLISCICVVLWWKFEKNMYEK